MDRPLCPSRLRQGQDAVRFYGVTLDHRPRSQVTWPISRSPASTSARDVQGRQRDYGRSPDRPVLHLYARAGGAARLPCCLRGAGMTGASRRSPSEVRIASMAVALLVARWAHRSPVLGLTFWPTTDETGGCSRNASNLSHSSLPSRSRPTSLHAIRTTFRTHCGRSTPCFGYPVPGSPRSSAGPVAGKFMPSLLCCQ